MSDTKKKPNGEKVNGDDTTTKATSKGSKFADKLNKIFGLCSELKNDSAGAVDYERTLEDNIILKATLQNCKDEITSLKAETEKLKQTMASNLGAFANQYSEFDAKLESLSSLENELKDTREKMAKKTEEIKSMEAENKTLKKRASDAETSRKRAETKLAEMDRECKGLQLQLGDAESDIRFYGEDMLSDVDPVDLQTKLEGFADKCHNVVMSCFRSCEVPPANINALEVQISSRGSSIPLSQSTSLPARLMRCAAAQSVIMNAIVDHIFTDTYFPGDIARQKAVSTTITLLEPRSQRREALVRCQFLSEFACDDEIIATVTQAAFYDICTLLDSLLPAGQHRDAFHAQLAVLLKSAVGIWKPLQTSKHRVSADFSPDREILERGDSYSEYDMSSTADTAGRPLSPGSALTSAVMILFPVIMMDGDYVADPKALWSDQAALVKARDEAMAEQNRLSGYGSPTGRADMARPLNQRRPSIGGRMGGPRSPTALVSSAAPSTWEGNVAKPGSLLSSRRENGVKAGAGQKG